MGVGVAHTMSDVACVEYDRRGHKAVHIWVAKGLSKLTTRNKLSSVPFPSIPPEDQQAGDGDTAATQGSSSSAAGPSPVSLRIVLLRGVSDADSTDLSVFLQTAEKSAMPVTIGVTLSLESLTGASIKADQVTSFDAGQAALGFRNVLSPEEESKATDDALVVKVTLDLAYQPALAFVKQGWGFGKSLFSSATQALSHLATTIQSQLPERTESDHLDGHTTTSLGSILCPWEQVPSTWAGNSEREERWAFLLNKYLPQTDSTFLGQPRRFTSDEEVVLAESGLSARSLTHAADGFDFERDVHEGLLARADPSLRRMRFELVPAKVDEVGFWRAYFWRIECLKQCRNELQEKVVLSVLNVPVSAASPAKFNHHAVSPAASPTSGRPMGVSGSPAPAAVGAAENAAGEEAERARATALLEAVAEAAALCDELLADETSDDDIVNATVGSLQRAIANAEAHASATDPVLAAARVTLARAANALSTASASSPVQPAAVAVASPAAVAAASTESVPATSPAEPDVRSTTSPEPLQTEALAVPPASSSDPFSSPFAAPPDDVATGDVPAATTTGGSASPVLMPWEEDDD
jgi:hypothetical protein